MRKIPFEGSVNRDSAVNLIAALDKLDAESDDDIFIVINGPGGCCFSMLGVVDAIRRARSKVGAIVVGQAMSADCFILACAEKGMRFAFPNAFIMVHEPRGQMNVLDGANTATMDMVNDLMLRHMKDMVHMSETELEEFVRRDQHLSATEALELGFIDAIIDDIER